MCGIVGIVAAKETNVIEQTLQCIEKLEYRGYDSAGIATLSQHDSLPLQERIQCIKVAGKVDDLIAQEKLHPLHGHIAIAHTRWATHGEPTNYNAHPHLSHNKIALVHNGIIENYDSLKADLLEEGYIFNSETDTEVIVHLMYRVYTHQRQKNFLTAIHQATSHLQGSFALAIINGDTPNQIFAVRHDSPLVIGLGANANYISSDTASLLELTKNFIYLEEGDIAVIEKDHVAIFDAALNQLNPAARPIKISQLTSEAAAKNGYSHYMLKEIYEQPQAIRNTLRAFLNTEFDSNAKNLDINLGANLAINLNKHASSNNYDHDLIHNHLHTWHADLKQLLAIKTVKQLQIVACGSSYHAGLVGQYWCESIAGLPCRVEIASEFRYRDVAIAPGTLFITISQSGETADTLAALRWAKEQPYVACLTICNVPESSLVRESNLALMTCAGIEVGVATTKAFTTQLVVLFTLFLELSQIDTAVTTAPLAEAVATKTTAATTKAAIATQPSSSATTLCPTITPEEYKNYLHHLKLLPVFAEQILLLDETIKKTATRLQVKEHAFYLGRNTNYPIALEGALKLKEISYLHAEAYPAGELKHGPLALIDSNMPVIVLAPHDKLWDKISANMQAIMARNGELIVFSDHDELTYTTSDTEIVATETAIKATTATIDTKTAANAKATANTKTIITSNKLTFIKMPKIHPLLAPILYVIPLQLLAYHVAVLRTTDVDQPRNLAKSVTVE